LQLASQVFGRGDRQLADKPSTDVSRRLVVDQWPVSEQRYSRLVRLAGNDNRSGRCEVVSNERQL
jgi:hypothetical protein